jgi:hypothetical protein
VLVTVQPLRIAVGSNGVGVGHSAVSVRTTGIVVVAVTAGKVDAELTTTVFLVHGGVVSMHEHSVLTKELACCVREDQRMSLGSGLGVGVAAVRFLMAAQLGVTVTIEVGWAVAYTMGGVLG